MKHRAALVLMTAAVFGGGLAAGLWMGRNEVRATPPPAWLYSEFNDITRPGMQVQELVQSRPDLWREINAELRELKPHIDEFRARMHEIDGDFRRDFEAVLTDEQKALLAQAQLSRRLPRIATTFTAPGTPPAGAAPAAPPSPAATPNQPAKPAPAAAPTPAPATAPRVYAERSDGMVSSFVFVPYTAARFVEVLGLDDDQEEKLKVLLAERRSRFLRLCDDTPPPSLQLNRIAEIIRRAQAQGNPSKGEK